MPLNESDSKRQASPLLGNKNKQDKLRSTQPAKSDAEPSESLLLLANQKNKNQWFWLSDLKIQI